MSDFPQGADWWKAEDGLWYPPVQKTDDGAPPPESTNVDQGGGDTATVPTAMKWVYGIAAIVVLGILFATCGGDDDGGSLGPSDLRFGAFDVCTKFVEDRLKAPGTASFRNYYQDDGEVTVTQSGDTYTVRSSVDAENSFGGTIRTDFTCTVRHTSGTSFRLVSLDADE